MLGQVAFGAWFVPALLVGWPLSRSLGHVSGVVLIPLAGQTVLGVLLHGALLVAGSRRMVGSFLGSLVISILTTSAVLATILLIYRGQITGSLDLLSRLCLVLFPVALTSAVPSCAAGMASLACSIHSREVVYGIAIALAVASWLVPWRLPSLALAAAAIMAPAADLHAHYWLLPLVLVVAALAELVRRRRSVWEAQGLSHGEMPA